MDEMLVLHLDTAADGRDYAFTYLLTLTSQIA